ncbi:MAG: uncharacterized protein QG670_1196 [Thermoproteota archaeon]|nr:uncharacterized protein [Thermoproteota archaeon]
MSLKGKYFDFPKGILWECKRCAKCCRDASYRERKILLLPLEAKQIARTLGFQIENLCRKTGLQPFTFEMKKDSEGNCIFLKGNECQIYTIRPLICRFYPFWLEKRGNGIFSFNVTEECTGIGLGPLMKDDLFKKLFDMAIGKLNGKRRQ